MAEQKPKECNGVKIPVDASKPNPNDVEFDNLYLDMNGIIHPCTHPEDKPAPKNEDEMMVAIFEYIDRLFNIVRPRRLLYMAIDGVAPRAKMNQQRSRRFRASKEGTEAAAEKQRVREEILARGRVCVSESDFLQDVCGRVQAGAAGRESPASLQFREGAVEWNVVIFAVPQSLGIPEGTEGGAALREEDRQAPDARGTAAHQRPGCQAGPGQRGGFLPPEEIKERFDSNCITPPSPTTTQTLTIACVELTHDELADSLPCAEGEFIFLRLSVLREYLERELTMASLPFTFDVERSIDDWVFMCFFVGNDFLPHLPSLEIRVLRCLLTRASPLTAPRLREGLNEKRKTVTVNLSQRITSGYEVPHCPKVKVPVTPVIATVACSEEAVALGHICQQMHRMNGDKAQVLSSPAAGCRLWSLGRAWRDHSRCPVKPRGKHAERHFHFLFLVKAEILLGFLSVKENRLWEAGWKQRYYKNKFDVDAADEKFRRKVVQSYVEGLCWVLRYYYQGCASWKWYYPFHYAPFASDFEGIADMPSDFEKGTKPFKPLEQLMGVFPAASGNFLPPSWRKLMSDPDSSIIDFYPEDFAIDLNGKKYAWQGVALLPFVDERRLRAALEEVYPDLTPEEARRNSLGGDVLFVGRQHPLHDFISELYRAGSTQVTVQIEELCPHAGFSDWEKSSNGRQWKPQLGFSRDRRPVHLDPAAFRTLGHVMPRGSGAGVYNNAAPPPATYQGSLYRPLLRGQAQIPKLMSTVERLGQVQQIRNRNHLIT
ncbi:Y48B6A.3 isoform 10-like protein [Camelus ferus]|nr:Y48B6A.3 isoform 10-like protein [Camelus ferus]